MTVREYGKFPCYGRSKITGIVVKFKDDKGNEEVVDVGNNLSVTKGLKTRFYWNTTQFTLVNYKKPIKYNKCLL